VLVSVDGQRGQFAVPFHGPLVFAMVLAGWMYSDVPSTNLLGGGPGAQLRRPA
jgi:hypothetical protein